MLQIYWIRVGQVILFAFKFIEIEFIYYNFYWLCVIDIDHFVYQLSAASDVENSVFMILW